MSASKKQNVGFLVMNVGKNAGGPESYERALLQEFAVQPNDYIFHLYCFVPVTDIIRELPKDRFVVHDLSAQNRLLSLLFTLPKLLKTHQIDFFHAPFVPPPFTSTPYLFTHHCFSPYNHPEFYDRLILLRLRPLISRGLKKAKHTLCVSVNVLQLSNSVLKIPESKMSVVHNGIDSFFLPSSKEVSAPFLKEKYNIEGPFFFFAGKLQKRKNIARILKAFRQFLDRSNADIKFVLAGSRTWASDDLDTLIAENGLNGKVIEAGYVPVSELPHFYACCRAFVFATLWEGFGIPLIEAMACGAPTITSNLSSLPEIAGDAALLVDPYSVDEISGAMLTLHEDENLRNSLVEKGFVQAKRFSWKICASETLAQYRKHFPTS